MAIRRYTRSDLINIQNPVNRNSPLNRGRVAWWLTLPQTAGGNKFYDLMGLNTGTLTNIGAGNGWRGTTRQGGFGHLNVNGSTNYVDCGKVGNITGALSISAWFTLTSLTGFQTIAGKWGTTNQKQFKISATFAGAGTPYFDVSDTGVSDIYRLSSSTVSVGQWTHLCGVYLPSTSVNVYFNGVLANGALTGTVPTALFSGTSSVQLATDGGTNGGGNTNGMSGLIDDVSIWNRALSASEVYNLYNDSRTGYPETLNRYSRTFAGISASGLLLERRRKLVAG